ncbi:twin-arginine translocation pathway signal protein [Brucella sp. IR073]|uniref:twin-arginine translocation pathway signal protein n=1 Tax=unclassified Brucella TaxID=2632610 RepID=UPI003B9827B6
MGIRRRDFIKGCVAVSVMPLPVAASAADGGTGSELTAGLDLQVEKSIKAGFGGGFSVLSYSQSNGLTYAEIEHFGNRYAVASADLQEWEIIRSSLSNPRFA